jgi:hypothetical protein
MKIVFVIFQVALILLLMSGPLLAQGVHDEVGLTQISVPTSTDEGLLSTLVASGDTGVRERLLPPAVLKNGDAEPSVTETLEAEFSKEESPGIGETKNEVEVSSISKETEVEREVPRIEYVAWRKKPIGQRALELASMESDKEILDVLQKEYGKEQLDRWLGLSRESKH